LVDVEVRAGGVSFRTRPDLHFLTCQGTQEKVRERRSYRPNYPVPTTNRVPLSASEWLKEFAPPRRKEIVLDESTLDRSALPGAFFLAACRVSLAQPPCRTRTRFVSRRGDTTERQASCP